MDYLTVEPLLKYPPLYRNISVVPIEYNLKDNLSVRFHQLVSNCSLHTYVVVRYIVVPINKFIYMYIIIPYMH